MGISISNLSIKIKQKRILDNVNLEIGEGITLIQGPNGIGKSVFLKTISGFFPFSGEVKFDGEIINGSCYPKKTGIAINEPSFPMELTGRELLEELVSIRSENIELGIKYAEQFKLDLDKKIAKYSLGMKKKLFIIQAIMENQRFILLDEPYNALDKEGIAVLSEILQDLRKQNKVVVMVMHINHLGDDVIDNVYEFEEGKLYKVK